MLSDENYVDVTSRFFAAVDAMEPGKVAVSPYFDMLEGARALEVGNSRLDSGLIELSETELSFDTSGPQPLGAVAAIMREIVVLYMSWINGLSLLVTVLGCRYVLDLLQNYKATALLKGSTFVNSRVEGASTSDATDSQLVNTVLRGYVIGMCKFVGFNIRVGIDILYDEEDLTTRSMDLDFFSQVAPADVVAEVDHAVEWLGSQESLEADKDLPTVFAYLRLARNLAQLEDVLHERIQLFNHDDSPALPALAKATAIVAELKEKSTSHSVPDGAISRFVQTDCNNKHIPSKNVRIDDERAFDGLFSLLDTVRTFVDDFALIKTIGELDTYLTYNVSQVMAARSNAVARGILQLFFIRDDKSIVGLDDTVGSLSIRLMELLCLCGNSLMDPSEWQLQDSTPLRSQCYDKLYQLLDDVEAAMYLKLNVVGNNRCRQRQLNNKNIVLWDSLQYTAESTELELFQCGVGDRLAPSEEQPALGISLFVFYYKLDIMIDVVLSGFEHDIYGDHEADLMYWYAAELAAHLYQHVSGRVREINQGKLATVTSLQKKIKKAKAGPKKEALKISHRLLADKVVPQVTSNIKVIEHMLSPSKLALYHLCLGVAYALQLMHAVFGTKRPTKLLVDEERQYMLRMKPWSSVGTPEPPSFKKYHADRRVISELRELEGAAKTNAVNIHVKNAKRQLTNASKVCKDIVESLHEDALKKHVRVSDVAEWVRKLERTTEMYQAQLSKVVASLALALEYTVKPVRGYLPYFPIYSVQKRALS